MATNTVNYNLKKPSGEDFYNVEDQNMNMDIIDTQINKLETGLEGHLRENKYQLASGSNAITILTGGDFSYTQGNPIKWIQAAANTGAVTINIDGKGAKALKNSDGTSLATGDLEQGKAYEAYYSSSDDFFTLRSGKGGDIGFFGKYTGTQLTLLDKISQGNYIYSNEPVQLELDNIAPISVDHLAPQTIINSVYTSTSFDLRSIGSRVFMLKNGWMVTFYVEKVTGYPAHIGISKDNGATWTSLAVITNLDTTKITSMCMDVYDTKVYVLVAINSINSLYLYTIDTIDGTVTRSNNIDTEVRPTSLFHCYLFIDDLGKMHAAWSCYSSNYINTYNIRYALSTDRVTFTTPQQITTATTGGSDGGYSNPSLYKLNNNDIVCLCVNNSFPSIELINIQTLSSKIIYRYSTGDNIYFPSLVQKNDDSIYVFYAHAYYSDAYRTLYYIKGYENGKFWDTIPANFNHEIAYGEVSNLCLYVIKDYNDDVYFIWNCSPTSTGKAQVYYIKMNANGVFGTKQQLSNSTNGIIKCFVCGGYKFFTSPIVTYYEYNSATSSYDLLKFTGVYTANSNLQLIPRVDTIDNENQIIAQGSGVLKTQGNELKVYSGFVSKKSKGWA